MHNQRSFDPMAAFLGGGDEEVSAAEVFQFQSMPHFHFSGSRKTEGQKRQKRQQALASLTRHRNISIRNTQMSSHYLLRTL